MIISSTVDLPPYIQDSRFKTAGWLSILSIVFSAMVIATGVLYSSGPVFKPMFFIYLPVLAVSVCSQIYVLIQFKRLLNERYQMYRANGIISTLVVIHIVIAVKDIIFNTFMGLPHIEAFMGIANLVVGIISIILVGIIQIVLGVYVLGVRDDPSGLLRIYSILYIVASCCLVTILLIPIALLLHFALCVILGIIFFKAAEDEPQVEFV